MNIAPQISVERDASVDELWYKDAIIYQLHVKAFFDSNGDGIGDFDGLTERLDYLQDLGVTALWLLPFYPSPGRDDGYDISDYRRINPDFGTMKDFRRFITEAKRRGLRVITELVVNHTSDQHPWFKRARRSRAEQRCPQLVRLERHRPEVPRHAHHLHRHREVQLGLGSGGRRLLLAPVLLASAGSQLRQSARAVGHPAGDAADGSTSASTASGSTRFPTCASAKAPTTRTSPRPTRSSRRSAPRSTPTGPAGSCSPRRTSGRKTSAPISATPTNATWPITSR